MIIADTGFWLALFNPRDTYHEQTKQSLQEYKNEELITTWPVLTETSYLILERTRNTKKALDFLEFYQNSRHQIFPLTKSHIPRIQELMQQYQNLPMDLADASLVIVAEELGSGRIFSVDLRDFNTYRWKNTEPFQNLFPL